MQKSKQNHHNNKKKSTTYFIYGYHSVVAALANPKRKKRKLYVSQRYYQEFLSYANSLELILATKQDFMRIGLDTDNTVTQTLALEVYPLESQLDLDKLQNKQESLVLILDHVVDPHNIGAILRTAASFAVDAVITTLDNSPGETSSLAKSASGALEIIPFVEVTNLVRTIEDLKKAGYWVYGLDGTAKSPLPKELPAKTCLILGSEESGIRRLVKENCDMLCKIEMQGEVESLNVSNAAAISIYAWRSSTKT